MVINTILDYSMLLQYSRMGLDSLNARCRDLNKVKHDTRTLQGVSNGLPHTTYRLPDRAVVGGSWY